jgi:hypothetical protein
MLARAVHASMASFTHVGIGTVRTRLCFETRSRITHRPSRCCMCPIVSAATSDRRNPQPRSTAMMARANVYHPRTMTEITAQDGMTECCPEILCVVSQGE